MNKKIVSVGLLLICFICLVLGLISPKDENNISNYNNQNVFNSIEVVGDRIALLNIEGAISSNELSSNWTNEFSLNDFINAITKAQKDDRVKAVLIRINSPGGTVAASQDIYDAIMRLKSVKPVIVSMADVAASGGYYVASAADRIVAQKGTMTGSIGVIFNFVDIADLATKIGITPNVIKSGKFKDAGSYYRKMSNEEHKLFKASVDSAYNQFITAIEIARVNRDDNFSVEKRILTLKNLKMYADGRVFLGEEAYKLGFIDKIGSQFDAQVLASEMAGAKNLLPLVSYNKVSGLKSLLVGLENKINLDKVLPFSYVNNSIPLVIWE